MGINLFENAYFGKPYKTRDGRKALYCYKFTKNSYALIVEGDDEFWYVRDDGLVDDWDDSFMDSSYYTDKDIVSEWTYEVEEPSKEQLTNLEKMHNDKKWKPSEKQLEALKAMTRYCDIATSSDAYKQRVVESLYSELKKLKEG